MANSRSSSIWTLRQILRIVHGSERDPKRPDPRHRPPAFRNGRVRAHGRLWGLTNFAVQERADGIPSCL